MSAVKSIYAGLRSLGLSEEEDRRDLYERVTGKRHLTQMRPSEQEGVLAELRRLGFRSTQRRRLEGPFARKLQALWIAAWNLGLVRNRDDAALLAFVKRQTGVDHTRFLHDPAAAARAIEALKGWLARDGGVDWCEGRDRPSWLQDHGAKIARAQWGRLAPGEPAADAFVKEVVAVTGPRSSLRALRSADWRAVTNSFGVRVRALPSSPARKEA